MANEIRKHDVAADIYTPQLINKAYGKQCGICKEYIAENEANDRDFCYSRTKRGSEVFIHMHCWNKTCHS